MNHFLAHMNPFKSKPRPWHEKYFDGKSPLLSAIGGIGLGAGIGAGLMYILDPVLGRSRRAHARDKVTSAINHTGEAVSKKSRDLKNRARGLASETGALFRRDEAEEGSELKQ